ncbi:B3 domain-containing protein [Nymphaea thermarum]|nr:B3 domain-containing protein [Nymphaea thermarum]
MSRNMEGNCDACPWKAKKFFKVMMDGYKETLKLPLAFVLNHLKFNGSTERATVEDHSGKLWHMDFVKTINGSVSLSGKSWMEFVMGHRLEIGDFVVFQYYGNFNFMARVFDHSNCEKKVYVGEASRNTKSRDAANSIKTRKPSFMKKIRGLKNEVLYIPQDFTDEYLLKEPCLLKLQNSDGREWRVAYFYSTKRSSLRTGWHAFCTANNLKAGDVCVFELDGQRCFRVQFLRKS